MDEILVCLTRSRGSVQPPPGAVASRAAEDTSIARAFRTEGGLGVRFGSGCYGDRCPPSEREMSRSAPCRILPHALARFRVHHPHASLAKVRRAVEAGERIETETALYLVGRPGRVGATQDVYLLAPSRRGLFPVDAGTVVTYLRFQQVQEAFALEHWPPAPEATAAEVGPGIHPILEVPLASIRVVKGLREAFGSQEAARTA